MRILLLSAWFPVPPDNGSKIRVHNLVNSLGARHELTLLSFRRPEDGDSRELEGVCKAVRTTAWRHFDHTRLRSILGFFSSSPRSFVATYSPAMAELVRATTHNNPFDVVIASTVEMARYASGIKAKARILEEHNFNTKMMADQYREQTDWLPRARYWLSWVKSRRYEDQVYKQFDVCTCVSELDARSVRAWLPHAPLVKVVPNGLDLRDYDWDDIIPARRRAIFSGSLTYSANLDAARYFVSAIWPLVEAKIPDARFIITGSHDGVDVKPFEAAQGVELSGRLPNIHAAFRECRVCVVPIRFGGGTRFKILEAMALGTPVVATPKGAEGLEVVHGENILIADNPSEFAEYTRDVIERPELARRLSLNARRLVEEKYDWNVIAKEFESLMVETVRGRDG